MTKFAELVRNFVAKVEWRLSLDTSAPPPFKLKSKPTPPCTAAPSLALGSFTFNFMSTMLTAAEAGINASKAKRHGHMPNIARWALKLMRDRHLLALQNDKDGGFCLLTISDLGNTEERLLNGKAYRTISDGELMAYHRSMRREAFTLAKQIEEAENIKNFANYLCKPLAGGALAATLNLKIKTHKGQGAILPRPLHSCPTYGLERHAKWIMGVCRRYVKQNPFLVVNAKDAKQRIEGTRLSGSELLIRLDLKDYFLSGTPTQIAENLSHMFATSEKQQLIVDVSFFLLSHQFVRSRTSALNDGPTNQCILGSGMGLPRSGDLCDALFADRVEGWLATAEVTHKFGIRLGCRFRDDALLVASEPTHEELVEEIQRRAGHFRVELLESTSSVSAPFLNLTIWKRRRDGKPSLCTKHRFKDMALSIPLSARSGQHASVQKTWPRAMLKSISSLCTFAKDASNACEELKARFSSTPVPLIWPEDRVEVTASKPRLSTLWCPMWHHPDTEPFLRKAMIKFNSENTALLKHLFGERSRVHADIIKFAWRNFSPALAFQVRTFPKR